MGSLITDDARSRSEITSQKKKNSTRRRLFTSKFDLNLRKKLVKCPIYGAGEGWTDCVKNEVLKSTKEERNVLLAAK